MTASKVWPAALTDTSALSPAESLGTRASETWTTAFICSAPSMTATGAVLEMKPPSAAFMVTRVPPLGAMTLPRASTFSSTVSSCSTLERALCIPASSWERVEFRWATAVWSWSSAWSISTWEAAPIS